MPPPPTWRDHAGSTADERLSKLEDALNLKHTEFEVAERKLLGFIVKVITRRGTRDDVKPSYLDHRTFAAGLGFPALRIIRGQAHSGPAHGARPPV